MRKPTLYHWETKKGYIRKRSKTAVLRYYLNYNNKEDLARGLLILFMPFRDELQDIHTEDVKKLLTDTTWGPTFHRTNPWKSNVTS